MEKRGILMVFGSIFLAFLLVAPAMAQVTTLKLADQNPQTGWGPVHALQPWAKKVEDATKGKVKIEIFPSQTLAKGPDIWNAVKSGIADVGWCFHGYWSGMTPLADVISLPVLPFTTAEKGSEILWKVFEKFPEIQKEFKDVKVLMLWTSHPYLLITTKKQVKTLEDIKGLKVRMTGGPPTDQMKALGGVPMMIPMPDNYLSLQKGVIDGMGAPWEAILSFRLYEVVQYYTETPFPVVYFSMSMNKNKWNGLPKDVQKAIMSVSGLEGSKFWGRNFFDTAKEGVYEKAKEAKREIIYYSLPPEEREKWLEVGGKPIWKDWVKKMEGKGLKSAQKILDATLELAKK